MLELLTLSLRLSPKALQKEMRTEEEEGGPMCVSAGGGARTQRVNIALVNNGEEDYQFVLSSQ